MGKKELTTESPLIRFILKKDLGAVKSAIEENPYYIEFIDKDGRNLLFYAILSNSIDIFEYLLRKGVNVKHKDHNGWTILHHAVQNNLLTFCQLIIKNKIDIDAVDKHGNSALWRAVFASKGNGDIIKLLLEKGANPTLTNEYGVSPYSLAEKIANYDIKKFFD